jgi:membrane protease YdiL (CAAX protease family)
MVNKRALQAAIAFAILFPTAITWLYFVALQGQSAALQQSAYALGKVVQFCFPVAWLALGRGQRLRWRPRKPRGLAIGLAFGLLVAAAMLGLYFAALKPLGYFEGPDEHVRRKIAGLGISELWKYALLGVFYALCHSFLEEYYWRWFVYRELKLLVPVPAAVAVSSLAFMSHHVLVLATFFGWQSPATYLFSLAVATGGAVWAWLYERARSLAAPWIGHCLVDAAIFVIGYDLARDLIR